jgi:hypothetical protein
VNKSTFDIYIDAFNGARLTVSTSPFETTASIKRRLRNTDLFPEYGPETSEIQLEFRGRLLEDTKFLGDYGVHEGSRIYCRQIKEG